MNLLCCVYSPKDDLHIFQFKLVCPCFFKRWSPHCQYQRAYMGNRGWKTTCVPKER